MRIGFSEDEDYPGQFNLWQGNCKRSLKGRKGQAILQELEVALLALPEKRLIADHLQDEAGGVCAVGALALYKNKLTPELIDGEDDMEDVGQDLGMPRLVAWKVVCLNDYDLDHVTPEVRYERVLAWVRGYLGKEKLDVRYE
jgi:hypothetical protein